MKIFALASAVVAIGAALVALGAVVTARALEDAYEAVNG